MRTVPWLMISCAAFACVLPLGCHDDNPEDTGTCAINEAVNCGVPLADGGTGAPAGDVIGYTCTGTKRPDDDPSYINLVPQGIVCSDRGSVDNQAAYCCSTEVSTCAFNPALPCQDQTSGFSCQGSFRPDVLNSTIFCSQGNRSDNFSKLGLVDYCCSGTEQVHECGALAGLQQCGTLDAWQCRGDAHPSEEDLGSNESRADYIYSLCATPIASNQEGVNYWCCFTPGLVPIGASCHENRYVPGCAPGRFGFACYGPDTPDQDFPPITCPDPGFAGMSAEGYPATLYCCDFSG
jgi:hypothetical protein